MVLVDTSVWVDLLRDRSGRRRDSFASRVGDQAVVLTRFTELELLQGARDEREWTLLREYLDGQDYLEETASTWSDAARIHFDLRRKGLTVASPIDCLIAQIALDHGTELLHRDHDFETIARIRALRESWLAW